MKQRQDKTRRELGCVVINRRYYLFAEQQTELYEADALALVLRRGLPAIENVRCNLLLFCSANVSGVGVVERQVVRQREKGLAQQLVLDERRLEDSDVELGRHGEHVVEHEHLVKLDDAVALHVPVGGVAVRGRLELLGLDEERVLLDELEFGVYHGLDGLASRGVHELPDVDQAHPQRCHAEGLHRGRAGNGLEEAQRSRAEEG